MSGCTSQDPALPEEPRVWCFDKNQNGYWRVIAPDASIILGKHGLDPCDVPGDARVSRQAALDYLKTVVF
jgi:hypothetical protein